MTCVHQTGCLPLGASQKNTRMTSCKAVRATIPLGHSGVLGLHGLYTAACPAFCDAGRGMMRCCFGLTGSVWGWNRYDYEAALDNVCACWRGYSWPYIYCQYAMRKPKTAWGVHSKCCVPSSAMSHRESSLQAASLLHFHGSLLWLVHTDSEIGEFFRIHRLHRASCCPLGGQLRTSDLSPLCLWSPPLPRFRWTPRPMRPPQQVQPLHSPQGMSTAEKLVLLQFAGRHSELCVLIHDTCTRRCLPDCRDRNGCFQPYRCLHDECGHLDVLRLWRELGAHVCEVLCAGRPSYSLLLHSLTLSGQHRRYAAVPRVLNGSSTLHFRTSPELSLLGAGRAVLAAPYRGLSRCRAAPSGPSSGPTILQVWLGQAPNAFGIALVLPASCADGQAPGWGCREVRLVAGLLYSGLTTGAGLQTLGEEYCDIIQAAGELLACT